MEEKEKKSVIITSVFAKRCTITLNLCAGIILGLKFA